MFTHSLSRAWGAGLGRLEVSENLTAGQEVNLSESIPAGSTDLLLALVLDVSQIASLYIKADRDMLLETNSGSAPGNAISLKAGKPVIWSPNCGMTCPLTVDVTALYVTLAAGEASVLELRCLVDPTV
jgi:hypothetical protein